MKQLAFLFFIIFSSLSFGQEYPNKAIRIIVPLTPGSGADIAGRIVAQRMSESWKQPVIVENRPGAGGLIGTSAVVKSDPDGYTLLVQSSSHSANPAIYKQLPYDPQKDLVDVAILGKTPYVMVSSAAGPTASLKALIQAAKAKPGELAFASAGVGTSTHLAAEYLTDLAGIKLIHVPFKGSAEAMQDVLAGRVAFYMAPINAGINLVNSGRLAPLGVSTKSRAEILPNVPTLSEQGMGLTPYEVTLWFGMWAHAGTPPTVVQKLNAAVNAIVLEPGVKEQFAKLGLQAAPMKADEFARFVRDEMVVYKRIVQQANIPQQ